ncbi:MAG: MFS transporter [Acetobacteraceae bacterium]|nr:MFS transporter [Acetobacteraceae bacterium]
MRPGAGSAVGGDGGRGREPPRPGLPTRWPPGPAPPAGAGAPGGRQGSPRARLFRHRPYLLYFTGTTVSMVGTAMQFVANAWLAMELTNRGSSIGIMLVCVALPGIALAPVIGVAVDRVDRRLLAAAMDAFRALALLVLPAAYYFHWLQAWHVYLVSFLIAVGDQVYNPTALALIREVVPPELLLYANSNASVSNQIGALLGSGLGGVMVAATSPIAVTILNAGSYLFSAGCTLGMRRGLVVPAAGREGGHGFRRFLTQLKGGVAYISRHRGIAVCYLLMLFLMSTLRTINVLLPPFARNVLRVGATGYGYIDATFAVGAILGNFSLGLWSRYLGDRAAMTFGMFALGGSLLLFALSRGLPVAMLGYLFIGITFQVRIMYLTQAQHLTDINYQGRVHSVFTVFSSLLALCIYAAMGFLGDVVSLRYLYLFQAGVMAAGGALAWRYIWRARGEAVRCAGSVAP